MRVGENELSSFELGALTNLKDCEVDNVLVAVTGNLNGFADAVKSSLKTITRFCEGTSIE